MTAFPGPLARLAATLLACLALALGALPASAEPTRFSVEVPKELKDRWHACSSCGLSVPRDLNSALEILRLGRSLAGPTWAVTSCVPAEAVGVTPMESSL